MLVDGPEAFHAPLDRQELRGRVNLFNWDGRGRPEGLGTAHG